MFPVRQCIHMYQMLNQKLPVIHGNPWTFLYNLMPTARQHPSLKTGFPRHNPSTSSYPTGSSSPRQDAAISLCSSLTNTPLASSRGALASEPLTHVLESTSTCHPLLSLPESQRRYPHLADTRELDHGPLPGGIPSQR